MHKTSILQCPSGKYTFCGDVPIGLCKKNEKRSMCGSEFIPKVFATKQEAENELKKNNL